MAKFSYLDNNLGGNLLTGTAAEQKAILLGKDIFFNGDYDVNPAGDYVTISGFDAIREAIYRRLITRPGEYKLRPEYGVGILDFVKKRRTQSNFDVIRQRVVDQLSLETRIDEVTLVQVTGIEDGITIVVVVRVAGESLKFKPFDFREGQTYGTLTNASAGLRIR